MNVVEKVANVLCIRRAQVSKLNSGIPMSVKSRAAELRHFLKPSGWICVQRRGETDAVYSAKIHKIKQENSQNNMFKGTWHKVDRAQKHYFYLPTIYANTVKFSNIVYVGVLLKF